MATDIDDSKSSTYRPKSGLARMGGMLRDSSVCIAITQTKLDFLLALLSTTVFIITAWFSQATFAFPSTDSTGYSHGPWSLLSHLDISDTLAILRLLQGVLSASTTFALLKAFDLLTWAFTKRDNGIRTLCLLGLSSTTGLFGTFGLLVSKHAKALDKAAAGIKLALIAAIWASGIVLFAKTQITIVYKPVSTYNVTAGVGPFRAPYVADFLEQFHTINPSYNLSVLPYSVITTASHLVSNPVHSLATRPIYCDADKRCQAYLIPGGLLMSTPWPPTDHDDYPSITIYNAPATQIDFSRGLYEGDSFVDAEDCLVYGSDGFLIGMKFCLAESKVKSGSLIAGLFVCSDGIHDGQCWTREHPPEVLTTFSVYQRFATVTSSRSNLSILAAHDLKPPVQQVNLDLDALRLSFSWLFNSTAADIPAPSSVAQYFWSVQSQLSNEYWSIEAYQIFQSLLAFPFWQFNDNNYGNTKLDSENIVDSLPKDFYTFAAVDKPLTKIAVNKNMFILFCVLQSIAIGFVWSVLIWLWRNFAGMPEISSYPLIDFAMKTQQCLRNDMEEPREPKIDTATIGHAAMKASATDANIRRLLKHDHIIMRRSVPRVPDEGSEITIEVKNEEAESEKDHKIKVAETEIMDVD